MLYGLIVVLVAAWGGRLATEISGTGAKFAAEAAGVTAEEFAALKRDIFAHRARVEGVVKTILDRVGNLEVSSQGPGASG